jgi:hypothetical protein
VEAVRKAGGVVLYDYELKEYENRAAEEERSGFHVNALWPEPVPPAPEWLVGVVGVDFFSDVVGVVFTGPHAKKEAMEEARKALPNCTVLCDKDEP